MDAVEKADTLRKAADIGQTCVMAFFRKRPAGVSETVEHHEAGRYFALQSSFADWQGNSARS
jgi:hypothetical protein